MYFTVVVDGVRKKRQQYWRLCANDTRWDTDSKQTSIKILGLTIAETGGAAGRIKDIAQV